MNSITPERGSVNPLLIASILLGVVAAGFGGAFAWAYGNYVDQRDNTSQKVSVAVTEAKKEQTATDEKDFLEREKQPYKQLIAPDDLGRVTISYPKTWSVYVAKSTQSGYEAYLHPEKVVAIAPTEAYAAHIVISDQQYETVIKGFESLVKKGDLVSAPVTINNFTGVRLDGKFSTAHTGSAVFFKVRDKTLTVSTDSVSYKADFENVIKSLDFNP